MEVKCLEKGSAFFLIHTMTSGLVADLRDGKAYMASGKGQSLCCPVVWSDWYGLKARLLAPKVKLVISVLYRCQTGSFALYTATSVLTTGLGRSIDFHCATLSSSEA